MLSMVLVLQDHVAAHSHEEGVDPLAHNLLDIWALNEGSEQFNELQGHASDPMRLLDLIVFV